MPNSKRVGAGTILKIGDGVTPTEGFTAIAKIRRIGEISEEAPLVDATDLESSGREYIGGLPDGSEFDVEAALLMDSTNSPVARRRVCQQAGRELRASAEPAEQEDQVCRPGAVSPVRPL